MAKIEIHGQQGNYTFKLVEQGKELYVSPKPLETKRQTKAAIKKVLDAMLDVIYKSDNNGIVDMTNS